MDFFELIKWALYVVTGVGTWFIKLLWNGQKDLEKEVELLKLKLSEEYVKKDDFKEAIADFKLDFKEAITPLCDKINKIDDYLREHGTK